MLISVASVLTVTFFVFSAVSTAISSCDVRCGYTAGEQPAANIMAAGSVRSHSDSSPGVTGDDCDCSAGTSASASPDCRLSAETSTADCSSSEVCPSSEACT